MYFSIFDKDTGDYLHSGRNSSTKKEAINDGIEYLYSDGAAFAPSIYRNLSLKSKEELLENNNLIVEPHTDEIVEALDDSIWY